MCEVLSDDLWKLQADFVYDNGVCHINKLIACLTVKFRFRLGRVTEKPLAHCTVC